MALTELQARKALPREKDYKLADSDGLHLFVTRKGHKSWRLKYRFGGVEKRLLLGPYPDVSLAKARELKDDARRLLRADRDPGLEAHRRKIAAHAAAGATFEKHAMLWHEAQKERWSPVQVRKVEQALRRDILPTLGRLPIVEVDGPMILKVLRRVDTRLEEVLSEMDVGELLVTGAQTDACIRSTLHGALVRGYDTLLVADAHTTEDLTQWGAPPPDQVIAHTNLYWSNQTAPGRRAETVNAAEVVFGAPVAGSR